MKYSDEQVLEAIRQDPIQDAENITGKSYKDDEAVGKLGFLLHMKKNEAVRHMLESRNDTTFSMEVPNYLQIIEDYGFECVFKEEFQSKSYDDKPCTETLYIYFKLPGLLLIFDTYRGHINGGKIYYNWLPNPECDNYYDYTSSGHFFAVDKETEDLMVAERENRQRQLQLQDAGWGSPEYEALLKQEAELSKKLHRQQKYAWAGDHDCRVALILNLQQLERNGKFIAWIEPTFVWCLHHMDTKVEGYDYRAITRNRLSQCPEYVQQAINLNHPRWKE
jgi:hypothetical protein